MGSNALFASNLVMARGVEETMARFGSLLIEESKYCELSSPHNGAEISTIIHHTSNHALKSSQSDNQTKILVFRTMILHQVLVSLIEKLAKLPVGRPFKMKMVRILLLTTIWRLYCTKGASWARITFERSSINKAVAAGFYRSGCRVQEITSFNLYVSFISWR